MRNKGGVISTPGRCLLQHLSCISFTVYACRTEAGASCRVSRLRYNGKPAYTRPM